MNTSQKKEALQELFNWFKGHIIQSDPALLDQWQPHLAPPDVTQKTDAEIDDLYESYVADLVRAMHGRNDRTSSFLCGMTISKQNIALALATQDILHRCWTCAVDRDGYDLRWARIPELWFHTKFFSTHSYKAVKAAFDRDPPKAALIKKCMDVKLEKSQVADRIFMSLIPFDIVTIRMRTWKDN